MQHLLYALWALRWFFLMQRQSYRIWFFLIQPTKSIWWRLLEFRTMHAANSSNIHVIHYLYSYGLTFHNFVGVHLTQKGINTIRRRVTRSQWEKKPPSSSFWKYMEHKRQTRFYKNSEMFSSCTVLGWCIAPIIFAYLGSLAAPRDLTVRDDVWTLPNLSRHSGTKFLYEKFAKPSLCIFLNVFFSSLIFFPWQFPSAVF